MKLSRSTWLLTLALFACGPNPLSNEQPELAPDATSAAEEHRGAMALDLYDVRDMTVPSQSYPSERWQPEPAPSAEGGAFESGEPDTCFEGDALADLVRETIDTSVWATGGEVCFREGGVLFVKAPQETHTRIRELLAGLRGAQGR